MKFRNLAIKLCWITIFLLRHCVKVTTQRYSIASINRQFSGSDTCLGAKLSSTFTKLTAAIVVWRSNAQCGYC